jgi:Fe(3+) dicitrate transport protein
MKIIIFFLIGIKAIFSQDSFLPEKNDKQNDPKKGEIRVRSERTFSGIKYMQDIEGTSIMAGKKNEVLDLTKLNANLTTNNNRQVYGKIPGISVWENDGSGIQTGVSTRGLSPNRAWEFNVRQNGYDIASDPFGYPEAYYTPPLEAVEKIEIVRGAGALQYGPQFGGLLNYVIKKADPNRPFSVETRQTGGSYNLFNSFNSVSGTSGKFSYYVFFHHRSSDSWRKDSEYKTQTGFVNMSYQFTEKLKMGIEFTRSQFISKQAAGLTDNQFQFDQALYKEGVEINPRQSNRSRNWFSAPWNLPVVTLDYEFDEKTKFSAKAFGLIGEKNSVGNTSAITIPDTSRTTTGRTVGYEMEDAFSPRRVDRDFYRNYGFEGRFIKSYKFLGINQSTSLGVRQSNGNTLRIRNTNGTRGSDFTLTETNEINGYVVRSSELSFRSVNQAFFLEHLIQITQKFSITPGVRYEMIQSDVAGYLSSNPNSGTNPFTKAQPKQMRNKVILGGVGLQYKITNQTNFYGNYTQAYRPVLFQELYAPGDTQNYFDPNLKNQFGYNADAGYRGVVSNFLNFDVGVFELRYNNRVGTIRGNTRTDAAAILEPTPRDMRTNVGDSLSRGVEAYLEYDPFAHLLSSTPYGSISGFVSYAQINAKYIRSSNPLLVESSSFGRLILPDNGSIRDLGIVGNRVENAPDQITRLGLTYTKKGIFSITLQNSQVTEVYTDANNTGKPAPGSNGQTGRLDGYSVSDVSFTLNITETISLRGGINNIENRVYATRRAGGYPGPGLLPADGRVAYLGMGANF